MKIELLVKYVAFIVLSLWVTACQDAPPSWVVVSITNQMTEKGEVMELKYDKDRKVTKYGDLPIKYVGKQVLIGEKGHFYPEYGFYTVAFNMNQGRAQESFAHCKLKTPDSIYEARKHTVFHYKADTIKIESEYRSAVDSFILKTLKGEYVFDKVGRLREVIMTSTDENDLTSSCYTYYKYDNRIAYQANLNLQAYVMDRDGADLFFYFLLNLGLLENIEVLPDEIGHCVEREEGRSNVRANYLVKDENVSRIEVLYNDEELLSRFQFSYVLLK